MLRIIGSVVAGIVTLGLTVWVIQMIGLSMYPLPEGVDVMDPAQLDALIAHMGTQPMGAWLFPFFSELLGAFAGGLVAAYIERRKALPLLVTVVSLALIGSVINWISFAHPLWYMGGQLVGYPLVVYLGWLATRSPRDVPVDPDAPTIPISDVITQRRDDERADDA
jgi:hypothetical protein